MYNSPNQIQATSPKITATLIEPTTKPSELIRNLLQNGFFKTPRTCSEVSEYWRTETGKIRNRRNMSHSLRRASELGLLVCERKPGISACFYIAAPVVQAEPPVQAEPKISSSDQSMGCAAILRSLLSDGFFSEPRTPKEARDYWEQMTNRRLDCRAFCVTIRRAVLKGLIVRACETTEGVQGYKYEAPKTAEAA